MLRKGEIRKFPRQNGRGKGSKLAKLGVEIMVMHSLTAHDGRTHPSTNINAAAHQRQPTTAKA